MATLVEYKSRFWSKVDASGGVDGCWPWLGAKNHDGYGQFRFGGKRVTAIRLAHLLNDKDGPGAGQVVRHKCDNPACVNPAHLLFGTFADNTSDMVSRGRTVITTAKLTPAQVVEIRSDLFDGKRPKEIGAKHGVSSQAIYDLRAGRTWSHVEGP